MGGARRRVKGNMATRQAQPRPEPPKPPVPKTVLVAGDQKDFIEPATKVAAALGWSGDPQWEIDGISVRDAVRYLTKVLHEAFQAAARGEPRPDYSAACEHLAVDNDAERSALEGATLAAYEAGKGAPLTEVSTKVGRVGANLTAKGADMLDALGKAK